MRCIGIISTQTGWCSAITGVVVDAQKKRWMTNNVCLFRRGFDHVYCRSGIGSGGGYRFRLVAQAVAVAATLVIMVATKIAVSVAVVEVY